MREIWDLYDKDKNLIGKTHERGKPLNAGEYHLVVAIWVVNDDGQILITRRHPDKIHGGLWEAPGGAVKSGEDSITGAKRELSEETGIECDMDKLFLLGSVVKMNWIVDIYLLKKNVQIDKFRLQKEEVTDAKWVCIPELEDMCSRNVIAPFIVNDFNWARDKIMQHTNKQGFQGDGSYY